MTNKFFIKIIKKMKWNFPFQDKDCEYYPCHNMDDMYCNKCYCSIYPCKNTKYGVYLKNGVWSCKKCTLVHTKEYVRISDILKKEK